MDRRDAIAWVLSVCAVSLRLSQAKTLSVLVGAALGLERVSLTRIGRSLAGPGAAKHAIKRCWRFIANDRVEPALAMRGVVARLLRKGRKPLLVSLDWTDVRGLQTLMATAVVRGRSVPLCWASCRKHVYAGHRSRNAFEEALLLVLRDLVPRDCRVIILADRGFGRTELGRFCQYQGFEYIFRIQPKVLIQHGSVRTRLDHYYVWRGICRRLDGVLYRAGHDPLRQHVVVRWPRHLPKRRDECWYLMTSLAAEQASARQVSDLYARRMGIEQFFRDQKSKRNGWSLRDTGLTDPARLDRLLLILALAYLLLTGLGLCAAARFRPGQWGSNHRPGEYSPFQIGRFTLDQLRLPIHLLLRALVANTGRGGKWG